MINRQIHPLPGPGDMVLDPGPRGIDTGAGNIGRAVAVTPTLRIEGVLDEARGRAALGKGIGDVGNAMGELALKQLEAIGIRQEADADNAITAAQGELQEKIAAEPDETKWKDMSVAHFSTLRDKLHKQEMSPMVREAVSMKLAREEAHTVSNVGVSSAQHSFSRAGKAIEDKLDLASRTDDTKTFNATGEAAVSSKYLSPERWEMIKIKDGEERKRRAKVANAEAVDTASNLVVETARTEGQDVAIQKIEGGAYGNLTAMDKELLRNRAQAVHNDRAGAMMNEVSDGIAELGRTQNYDSPNAMTEAKIDAIESPFFSAAQKEQAKKFLEQQTNQETRAAIVKDRETNGVRNAVELRRKVQEYDPKSDADRTKYFQLVHEIGNRVEQSQAGELTGELYKKYGGATPKLTVPEEIQKNVRTTLDEVTFNPMTGAIPWKSEVKDARGNKTVVIDPVKQQQAINAQTVIEQKMKDWYATHPEDVNDVVKVQKALGEAMTPGMKMGALDALMRKQGGALGASGGAGAVGALGEDLVATVKGFEGFEPSAVGDYKQTSVGYGTRAKHDGEKITPEDADKRLREELTWHAGNIDKSATAAGVKLSKGQRDALISFDFNTGKGAYLIESSGGDLAEIKRRLQLYTKAGGDELPGLVNRRTAEAKLFDQ